VQAHAVWRKEGFWDSAMLMGISHQLDLQHPTRHNVRGSEDGALDPDGAGGLGADGGGGQIILNWDDIESEVALVETVIELHNCIFGQLGSLALTMHDVGLEVEVVEETVLQLCKATQLTEDQEIQLLRNVRKIFAKDEPMRPSARTNSPSQRPQSASPKPEASAPPVITYVDSAVGSKPHSALGAAAGSPVQLSAVCEGALKEEAAAGDNDEVHVGPEASSAESSS
jgi:hypothetical protein